MPPGFKFAPTLLPHNFIYFAMASSASSSRNSPTLVEKCYCGAVPRCGVSGTPKNPGKRFKTCPFSNPNPKGPKSGCRDFKWVDTAVETMPSVSSLTVEDKFKETVGNAILELQLLGRTMLLCMELALVIMVIILVIVLVGVLK